MANPLPPFSDPPLTITADPEDGGRGRLFAGARQRVDGTAVRAYSRKVRSLRVLLPLAAAALAGAVFLWPSVGPEESKVRLSQNKLESAPVEEDVLRMEQPRFVSTDPENRPFELTADLAVQTRADQSSVTLTAPKADLINKDGSWMQLSAEKGHFSQREERVDLEGGVTLFHDSGMEMHSEKVSADLKQRTMESSTPVVGQGPQGDLEARDGFRITERGQRIELLGQSRVVVRGGA